MSCRKWGFGLREGAGEIGMMQVVVWAKRDVGMWLVGSRVRGGAGEKWNEPSEVQAGEGLPPKPHLRLGEGAFSGRGIGAAEPFRGKGIGGRYGVADVGLHLGVRLARAFCIPCQVLLCQLRQSDSYSTTSTEKKSKTQPR